MMVLSIGEDSIKYDNSKMVDTIKWLPELNPWEWHQLISIECAIREIDMYDCVTYSRNHLRDIKY